ncbi:MAG: isoleucine--tRNA ligase, partial [Fimbriimonadaceae bacterium]|nr:isoleucine--tRNA ligase [Fimbriimonadaceae bacterium]
MKLKDTLNLPDPDFTIPMKADLPSREPSLLSSWNQQDIYRVIQQKRAGAATFVLHDGPPYTNGPIHIGTALNKVLKDFVVKSQTIMGKRAPYVPGYDNHGLPIEMAVMKKFADQKVSPDLLTLRKACRDHAQAYIGIQTEQFVRLGVFGTWDRPYTSMDFRYEAEIIRVFRRLVEGGYIYRGLRPVLWSPTSRTALADTEIEYKDHTSTAIIVAFPLREDTNQLFGGIPNVATLIWTTTPWTIPANLAVAYHPEFTYDLVRVGADHYLLLHELVEKTLADSGLVADEVVRSYKGQELEGTLFSHPIFDRASVAVLANYVTTEDGTGVVHTAPGHGRDDFYTGQKYGLSVLCPVDEKGVLTDEAGEFAGTFYKKCDTVVVDRLRELGKLLDARPYHHSYPHAERDGQPVIFRATEQWFISVEKDGLRLKMLDQIQDVKWVPENGEKRLSGMIGNRPDWCVSRQRPWGVGIPIFYGAESGEPVLDPAAIEAVAKVVENLGSDAWYDLSPDQILPPGYRHPTTGETEFRKETDVFDVWFDSACTNLCVLEGNVEPEWKEEWPADLFFEGSDQHRGWFNVSLIVGSAVRGEAPYRGVVTHGMVVDEKGQKMSKRLGNVIDPVEVCNKYGADVLRVWVASVDYENDMPCSDKLLQVSGETYRTLRNTMRFLLGNLSDYEPTSPRQPEEIDQWITDACALLAKEVLGHYENYAFNKALAAIHNFCVNQLSKVYLDAIKDRMYCERAESPARRAAQAACHSVL